MEQTDRLDALVATLMENVREREEALDILQTFLLQLGYPLVFEALIDALSTHPSVHDAAVHVVNEWNEVGPVYRPSYSTIKAIGDALDMEVKWGD